MNKKLFPSLFAVLLSLCAATVASADFKIRTKTTTAGQSIEGASYIKAARQRTTQSLGDGMELVTITQCDLKRVIQVNDSARTYLVTPMREETSPSTATAEREQPRQTRPARTRRGGVITYTSVITDTGERKKMFGFTARHIKTTMTADSSPDACNPTKMRVETDGWYIDLEYGFDCETDRPALPSLPMEPSRPECVDEVRFKASGGARLGYPVLVTTTIYGDGGQTTTTMTTEVLELSKATLDPSLFDVPPGYREVKGYQELMGMPSIEALMRGEHRTAPPEESVPRPAGPKSQGAIRVGVLSIANKTGRPASLASVRNGIIAGIAGFDVDAVALDSSSPAEIEAEAKQKACDYILYTDLSELKKSGKLGGMLGRAAGIGGLTESYETRLDFRLFPVSSSTPRLVSSATAKEEGSEDVSLLAAAEREAKAVATEVRKKK